MAIVPCPEKIGPRESGSVTDIADGNGNARSTILPPDVASAVRRISADIRVCYGEMGGDTAEAVTAAEFTIKRDMATILDWIDTLDAGGLTNERSTVLPTKCNRCGTIVTEPPPPTYATPDRQAAYLAALAERPHVEYPAVYVAHPEWPPCNEPPTFRAEIDRLTELLPRAILNIPEDLFDDAEARAKLLDEADAVVILPPGKSRRISHTLAAQAVAATAQGKPVLVHHPTRGTAAWVDCEMTGTGKVRLPKPSDPPLETFTATVRAMGGTADTAGGA